MPATRTRFNLTRSRLILIASLFSLSLSSAFAQSTLSETLAADPVFQSNCAKCHGKDADGRFMAGPSLISKKASARFRLTRRAI